MADKKLQLTDNVSLSQLKELIVLIYSGVKIPEENIPQSISNQFVPANGISQP